MKGADGGYGCTLCAGAGWGGGGMGGEGTGCRRVPAGALSPAGLFARSSQRPATPPPTPGEGLSCPTPPAASTGLAMADGRFLSRRQRIRFRRIRCGASFGMTIWSVGARHLSPEVGGEAGRGGPFGSRDSKPGGVWMDLHPRSLPCSTSSNDNLECRHASPLPRSLGERLGERTPSPRAAACLSAIEVQPPPGFLGEVASIRAGGGAPFARTLRSAIEFSPIPAPAAQLHALGRGDERPPFPRFASCDSAQDCRRPPAGSRR